MSDLTPRLLPRLAAADPAEDPRPEPPREPGPDDCCHSGCTWCVLDLYYDDLEKYKKALKEWEAREKARRKATKR